MKTGAGTGASGSGIGIAGHSLLPLSRKGIPALAIVCWIAGCADSVSRPPEGGTEPLAKDRAAAVTEPAETEGGLIEIPRPELEPLEHAVREQIRAGEEALDAAIAAAGEDPSPADLDSLGSSYGELGKLYHAYQILASAEACYRNAQRLRPDDYRWPYYLAHLHLEEGATERAIAGFRRALELKPADPPARLHLARAHFDRGEPETAAALLRQMLQADPRSAPALAALGRLAAEQGDHRAAARQFEAALRVDPGASELHYPLGLAYRGLGDLERARHFLERRGGGKAALDDPLLDELEVLASGMRLHQNRGSEAFLQGRFAEAAEHYRRAAEAEPSSALAHANLASALTRLGRFQEAQSHYQRALAIESVHADANRNYGTLLARLGQDERAVAHYRRALAVDAGNAGGHFNLANALRRLGRFDQAAPHYRQAIESDPRRRRAHLALALTLVKLERWAEAIDVLEAARAIFPDERPLTQALARLLASAPVDALRDGRRAHEIASSLLETETSLDHVETMAMAVAEIGRYEQAIVYQRQALEAARGARRPDLVSRLSANLERYQAGRPCRAPWPPDDPVLAPKSRSN